MENNKKDIAIAFVHGVGKHGERDKHFADDMQRLIVKKYQGEKKLAFESIFWGKGLQSRQNTLWDTVTQNGSVDLDYKWVRYFFIDFVGDIVAYQRVKTPNGDNIVTNPADYRHTYEEIHTIVSKGLNVLNKKVKPDAPLCIIAHSMGSVIASNYIYDQWKKSSIDKEKSKVNEMNFVRFYTMGSPLAVWSLRSNNFNKPIKVDSWVNFYDKDDAFAYPLSNLYGNKQWIKDVEVNVGGLFLSWNPGSHIMYWTDDDVIDPIVEDLQNL
jgi:hypothetical protein